mmetsp:Transcript_17654/g.23246  ORF Transcript_17654/g.23246 Transcript_17654/m.23246 type:complete len:889 (+) Transcript_17654:276-2942(+)
MHSEVEVKNAYTGAVHKIGVHSNLSLGEFQALLAGASGVVAKHQVLLAGPPYSALKRSRDLRQLAQTKDRGLFLFNKVMLSPEAPEPSPVILEPQNFVVEPLQLSGFVATDDQPMQQALIKIETKFAQEVVATARGRVKFGKARARACQSCLAEQQVQVQALTAATLNLKDHCEDLRQKYRSFTSKVQELKAHQAVLDRFEDDLQQLRKVALHMALRSPGQETLYDCMPVEKQRKFARKMVDSQKRLDEMAAAVSSEYQVFTNQATQLGLPVFISEDGMHSEQVTTPEDAWMETLRREQQDLDGVEALVKSQEEDLVLIEASYATILKRVKDELYPPAEMTESGLERSRSEITIAALADVDKIRQQRDITVEKMKQADEGILQVMEVFGKNKTALTLQLTQTLQQISGIQNQIKMLSGHFTTFHAAVAQVGEDLGHLTSVQQLPKAYRSFLREVVRHRAYARVFEKKVNTAVEEIAAFRQSEVSLREAFLRESGTLLPKEFLDKAPALTEAPAPFAPMLPPEPDPSRLPRIVAEDESEVEAKLEQGHYYRDEGEEEDGGRVSEGQMLIENDEPFGHDEEEVTDLKNRCDQLNYENLALKTRIEALEQQLRRRNTKQPGPEDQHGGETMSNAVVNSGEKVPPSSGIPNQDSISKVSVQECSTATIDADAEQSKLFHSIEEGNVREMQVEEAKEKESYVLFCGMKRIHKLVQSLTFEEMEEDAPASPPILRKQSSTLDVEPEEVVSKVYEVVSHFKERIKLLQDEVEERDSVIDQMRLDLSAVQQKDDQIERIAFRNFDVGNIALFMPLLQQPDGERQYLAFNIACPYRFLSDQSIDIFKEKNNGVYPDFVIGRIVIIERFEAELDSNPFDLRAGTIHYILTVETLENTT